MNRHAGQKDAAVNLQVSSVENPGWLMILGILQNNNENITIIHNPLGESNFTNQHHGEYHRGSLSTGRWKAFLAQEFEQAESSSAPKLVSFPDPKSEVAWFGGEDLGVSIVMGVPPQWTVYKGESYENGWWLGVFLFMETTNWCWPKSISCEVLLTQNDQLSGPSTTSAYTFRSVNFPLWLLPTCSFFYPFICYILGYRESHVLTSLRLRTAHMAEAEEVAELFCCGICEDLMLAPITSETQCWGLTHHPWLVGIVVNDGIWYPLQGRSVS